MSAPQSPSAPILGQALPVELMNTIWADRQGVHDSLASPDDARRWIDAISPRLEFSTHDNMNDLGESGLACLRDLRDALRRIAAERTGDPREPAASAMTDLEAAIRTVNEAARLAHIWPTLTVTIDGAITDSYEPSGGQHELLVSTLATQGIELFGSKNDLDLRACLAPGCVLYFIKDHPRREWCSNACGNRTRAARHYARHGRRDTE